MPPKRGTKRKAAAKGTNGHQNGDVHFTPPDRATWPGWVEMESEPAFFNVMLRDLGIQGVKIQEIFSMDEEDLACLPQPVHAFIFCFRYKDTEMTQEETECPPDVWFANQIPEFACASVALLNIVNNIEGLRMGKEMRDFKTFTNDLDPMGRGDAIDGFDYLKRIHNSFARETDMLNADMHIVNKIAKDKKRQATLQAQATKKAKKEAAGVPEKKTVTKTATALKRASRAAAAKKQKVILDSDASSHLSDAPELDGEFETTSKAKNASSSPSAAPRRSGRQPKPRKDPTKLFSEAEAEPDDDGFHFVAYVPINGRVWRMDGLDSFPHFVGDVDEKNGGIWTNVAGPEIQARMMMFGGQIEYNLMAVVHDPLVSAREGLARNVKDLQTIDAKLDQLCPQWKTHSAGEPTPEGVLLGMDLELDLSVADINTAPVTPALERDLARAQNSFVGELLQMRKERMKAQAPLRGSVRDELGEWRADEEKARLTRHDFGGFVRGWLGALADQEILKELVEEEL